MKTFNYDGFSNYDLLKIIYIYIYVGGEIAHTLKIFVYLRPRIP